MPSAFIRGLRSVHAPDAQKLPVLSVEKDCATSGALPPRIAATILSSLMPPTVFTFTPGCACSKSATTRLIVLSSRAVNPTQSVTVAGASGFSAVPPEAGDAAEDGADPDEDDEELEPPPPHAAATSAAATSARVGPVGRRRRGRIALGTSAMVLPSSGVRAGSS